MALRERLAGMYGWLVCLTLREWLVGVSGSV
jgi:hypothetical protein